MKKQVKVIIGNYEVWVERAGENSMALSRLLTAKTFILPFTL